MLPRPVGGGAGGSWQAGLQSRDREVFSPSRTRRDVLIVDVFVVIVCGSFYFLRRVTLFDLRFLESLGMFGSTFPTPPRIQATQTLPSTLAEKVSVACLHMPVSPREMLRAGRAWRLRDRLIRQM